MSLRHFQKNFKISPKSLEESELLLRAKKTMGDKLYGMANRVFTEFVESRDESLSGGYFKFSMAVGNSGQSSKGDVDYLWDRMLEIYGADKPHVDFIKRVLGTILMACVAKDGRAWAYKDDPYKKSKLEQEEIPEATEYFIFGGSQ